MSAQAVTTVSTSGASHIAPRFKWDAAEAGRRTLFPIKNQKIWEFRKLVERLHWTVEEVDMSGDRKDWETRMDDGERHFVRYILGLVAIFDNIVIKNLKESFEKRLGCMEAAAYLAAQEDQEWVHAEAYMLQSEGVAQGDELNGILNSIETMPAVKTIVEWANKYLNNDMPDGDVLIAWAFVEGVLFQGPFCGLQWLRDRKLLPGVTEFNQFIARDEGVHTLFTCHIVKEELLDRPTRIRAHAIANEAFKAAAMFIDEALPKPLHNMTANLMKQYVQFQTDCVLAEMGYRALFGAKNPFPFMDALSLQEVAKANFFERRSTAYSGPVKDAAVFSIDESPIKY